MKLFSTTHQEHATNEAWLRTWVIVAILLGLLCGCRSDCAPSFAKATPQQRKDLMFIWDNSGDYEASEQYQRDNEESYANILQIKKQIGHEWCGTNSIPK